MPINNIDYSKTIIYKIQHKEKPELIYIGHTTNFDSRKYQHQKASNDKNQSSPFYKRIQENGGWNSFIMAPIKQISCDSRIDALIEEQKTIDELGATLNYCYSHKATAKHKAHVYRKEYDKEEQERDAKMLPHKQRNACNYFIDKHLCKVFELKFPR